jgi:hypothetical protein
VTATPWLDRAKLRWVDRIVLGVSLVGLVASAATFPVFDRAAAGREIVAAQLGRSAASPLWDSLAGAATAIPIGEPAGRVALLGAVVAAFLLLGVMRAARSLLPRDPLVGLVGVVLLALAPPFRAAAATGSPGLLAALGCVWLFVALVEYAGLAKQKESSVGAATAPRRGKGDGRAKANEQRGTDEERAEPRAASDRSDAGAAAVDVDRRFASAGMACVAWAGVIVGCSPYLGVAMVAMLLAWVQRPQARVAMAIGGVLVAAIVMWAGAEGSWPTVAPDLASAIAATGAGSASIVVGAGLLGVAFGVATGLAHAKRFGVIAMATMAAVVLVGGHDPMPVLAVMAVGVGVLPAAVVRVVGASDEKPDRRHWIALVAGVPLVGAALATGAAVGADDTGDSAIVAAADLVGDVPPGPALIVETREASWAAVAYELEAAGNRPDLGLAPPAATEKTDAAVAGVFRIGHLAASDVLAFGRLDPERVAPRGRGFQLLPEKPVGTAATAPEPADYRGAAGQELAMRLAVERARYEAGEGRLDQAARAAGLVASGRFRAADLAVLATTTPTARRPAFFGFLTGVADEESGTWLLDLLGDDLAWVGGVDETKTSGEMNAPRKLHALWRRVWKGEISESDPAIAALGPRAVKATKDMLATLRR